MLTVWFLGQSLFPRLTCCHDPRPTGKKRTACGSQEAGCSRLKKREEKKETVHEEGKVSRKDVLSVAKLEEP